jgi:sucrose-phosphate synthase
VTAFALDNQAEMAAAYRVLSRRASVFVLTSFYESFGLAPLEAMGCGLPVVVTKNGGPSENLLKGQHEFGVLVDPEDPHDISEGLLRLIESYETWKRFSDAGIAYVCAKFTWNRAADQYLSVIEELLGQETPCGPVEIPPWFSNPTPENEIPPKTLAKLYFG